jgi:NAD(P)-dependent dehydrogenase (short-subunit alcohol dehydrogenase family)
MKRLVVTGYNSSIAIALFELVGQRQEIEIIRCGRCEQADAIFDFSQLDDCRGFTSFVEETTPDFLFLNHGLLIGDKLKDHNDQEITKAFYVNLVSVAMVLERLVSINKMRTVVMSSISGKVGSYDTLYAATKAGVDLLIKSFAPQLPSGSRLNAISPGIIEDARMTTVRTDLDVLATKKKKTPTQVFCSSMEVAQLTYFLLFEAGNLTGENLNVNGGLYVS